MKTIKIKSGGLGYNTRVFDHNNKEITGIAAIDIKIRPNALVEATLILNNVELDVVAEQTIKTATTISNIWNKITKWYKVPR